MTQNRTVAAVVLVVAAMIAAPVAAAAAGSAVSGAAETTDTPEPGEDATAPGEKLTGVVAVQGSELDGEMRERTFGARVASAESDRAKADVVAEELDDLERRLAELEDRKEEVEQARENGEISGGTYRAEMAEVAAETANAKRMANHTERVASELPADLLAEKGINVEAIQTLKDRAADLSGPEVAEIAKSIAGDSVGTSIAGEKRPEDIPGIGNRSDGAGEGGPPGDDTRGGDSPANASGDGDQDDVSAEDAHLAIHSAEERIAQANQTILSAEQRVGDSADAQAALERARENLTAAEDAVADARAAADSGDYAEAVEHAEAALQYADAAMEDALEARDGGDGGAP